METLTLNDESLDEASFTNTYQSHIDDILTSNEIVRLLLAIQTFRRLTGPSAPNRATIIQQIFKVNILPRIVSFLTPSTLIPLDPSADSPQIHVIQYEALWLLTNILCEEESSAALLLYSDYLFHSLHLIPILLQCLAMNCSSASDDATKECVVEQLLALIATILKSSPANHILLLSTHEGGKSLLPSLCIILTEITETSKMTLIRNLIEVIYYVFNSSSSALLHPISSSTMAPTTIPSVSPLSVFASDVSFPLETSGHFELFEMLVFHLIKVLSFCYRIFEVRRYILLLSQQILFFYHENHQKHLQEAKNKGKKKSTNSGGERSEGGEGGANAAEDDRMVIEGEGGGERDKRSGGESSSAAPPQTAPALARQREPEDEFLQIKEIYFSNHILMIFSKIFELEFFHPITPTHAQQQQQQQQAVEQSSDLVFPPMHLIKKLENPEYLTLFEVLLHHLLILSEGSDETLNDSFIHLKIVSYLVTALPLLSSQRLERLEEMTKESSSSSSAAAAPANDHHFSSLYIPSPSSMIAHRRCYHHFQLLICQILSFLLSAERTNGSEGAEEDDNAPEPGGEREKREKSSFTTFSPSAPAAMNAEQIQALLDLNIVPILKELIEEVKLDPYTHHDVSSLLAMEHHLKDISIVGGELAATREAHNELEERRKIRQEGILILSMIGRYSSYGQIMYLLHQGTIAFFSTLLAEEEEVHAHYNRHHLQHAKKEEQQTAGEKKKDDGVGESSNTEGGKERKTRSRSHSHSHGNSSVLYHSSQFEEQYYLQMVSSIMKMFQAMLLMAKRCEYQDQKTLTNMLKNLGLVGIVTQLRSHSNPLISSLAVESIDTNVIPFS